jgi:indolepyruvate ferredoxin oxidoreductase
VEGGQLKKRIAVAQDAFAPLAPPPLPALDRPYGILVTGVGGTGVVTIGAILGMAAHLEGKAAAVLDMAGLAQKGGSVYSHIRIAVSPDAIHAVRIAAGEARLVLGCDMIVAASDEAIAKMQTGFTRAVINSDVAPTGGFTQDPDLQVPSAGMAAAIDEACGKGAADFLDATRLATSLLGDSIATNLFMVGYAWQKGFIPLGSTAILQAIELNGAAVESNRKAFEWGRRAASDLAAVQRAATPAAERNDSHRLSETLEELVERRRAFLVEYQDAAYARRFTDFVERVRSAEALATGSTAFTAAVARYLFKLMAYKDEYEVARLYTQTDFVARVAGQFEGDYRLKIHLAPPLWAKTDPATGEPRKRAFGAWMLAAMRVLARLRGLRGGALDPFGYSAERRTERRLISEYRAVIEELLPALAAGRLQLAVEIASIPELIRGYGPVKERHLQNARAREAELLARWRAPGDAAPPAPRIPIPAVA